MLRRLFAAGIALAALILPVSATSAAADDYGPDDLPCDIAVDSATVALGAAVGLSIVCDGTFTAAVTVTPAGEAAGDEAVAVAGTSSETVTIDGSAAVTIGPFNAPGAYTVSLTDTDGNALAAPVTVTVVGAADDGDEGGLAVTGPTSLPYLGVAGGLLLLGVIALVATRVSTRRSS